MFFHQSGKLKYCFSDVVAWIDVFFQLLSMGIHNRMDLLTTVSDEYTGRLLFRFLYDGLKLMVWHHQGKNERNY